MSRKYHNLLDCHQQMCQDLKQELPDRQARQTISEVESALFRILFEEEEFIQECQGKITKEIKQKAYARLAQEPVTNLSKCFKQFEANLKSSSLSQSSLYTYGARGRMWFERAFKLAGWLAQPMSAEFAAQCAPHSLHGHKSITDVRITNRRWKHKAYALQVEEMNSDLRSWYDKASTFFTRQNQPGRVFPAIAPYTLIRYQQGWRLILGWQTRYNGVPLDELGPQHLFPIVDLDEYEELTPKEQKRLWRQKQKELETIICGYRDFQVQEMKALSPHTWHARLVHIYAAGRVLYADWVQVESEYDELPIFKTLRTARADIQDAIKERQTAPDVAGLATKWPEVPAHSTALEFFQTQVLEPMRLECVPKTWSRKQRSPRRLAHRLQQFLRVGHDTLWPSLRQQVGRTLRVALSCPIQRPQAVPQDGLYYPLPPEEVREHDQAGKLADNYLYRTYRFNGRAYPEGVWIREVQQQKTRKSLGVHQTLIPNRRFADGRCFYEYLEDYLQGIWQPQSWDSSPYQWTDPRFQGTEGNWVSAGRSEFEPQDEMATDADDVLWRMGYLFVSPTSGLPYSEHTYHECIRTNSNRLIGKPITPHTTRYFWATWAFQVGLSDSELRSLAYMMGHTVDTLRRMYVKMTPEEQQRPIEEAINARLCRSDADDAIPLNSIIRATYHLTRDEQRQLLIHLKRLLDDDEGGAAGALQPV